MDFRVTNTTDQPIELVTGQVVPADGSLEVEGDAFDRLRNDNYFKGKVRRNDLTWERLQPETKEPLTRTTVAKMTRAELVGLLGEHGYEPEDLKDMKVEDSEDEDGLRTLASVTVFGGDDDDQTG